MATGESYTQSGGIRQDLVDVLTKVNKHKTPMVNMLKKGTAKNRVHTWIYTQVNGTGSTNARIEGAAVTTNAPQSFTEYSNYTQIIGQPFNVSRTETKVNYAGVKNYIATQKEIALAKVGMDTEYSALNGTGHSGGAGTAREMRGMAYYVSANTATVAATALSSTSGTTQFEAVLQGIFDAGAIADFALVNSANKLAIDKWTANTTKFTDAAKAKLASFISVYESSMGRIDLIIDTQMSTASIYVGQMDKLVLAYLDTPHTEDLAKTTDGYSFDMVCEVTLEVLDPNSVGELQLS